MLRRGDRRSQRGAVGGVGAVFFLIGWALLAAAFLFAWRTAEVRNTWIETEGEIVEFVGDDAETPVVEYVAPDGERKRVTGRIASSPRAGAVGDIVPVYVNPLNHEEARIGTLLELWFFPGLFGAIGAVFAAIGIAVSGATVQAVVPGLMSPREVQRLRETGERVMARVTRIVAPTGAPRSRIRAVWRIEALWINPATNAPVTLLSQPIPVDPSEHVAIGDEIGVFIDRDNPKRYAFDFSMLPFGADWS